jgi:AraC-like DNA-binding protein
MLARSSKASWAALDPVSALLIELRVQGTFFCNSDIATPWVMEVPARDFASFHYVVSGECWLALPGERPRALAAGQLALVVRSPAHRLASQRNLRGKLVDFRLERRLSEAASTLHQGEGDSRTHLICGGLHLQGFVANTLASLLPEVIVTDRRQTGAPLRLALEAMSAEAKAPRAGSATLTRVRMYRALDALQRETVSIAELAHRLGYDSEAAFARAFKRHIGMSPSEARRRDV